MTVTCNTTLEDLRITGEKPIAASFTFHELALTIGGGCTIFSIILSFYLILRHANNYTKPAEQKYIIRILFMAPVYAVSSWLQIYYYYHAIYYSTISDCYEAFAIASFFALMCQYTAEDLHHQKAFFRELSPLKRWVWPVSNFQKCCGGQRGIWRTPQSGLTWFNIVWIGVFQYCFIRVAMTITAVVLQYFGRYCQSSDNPKFGHVWVLVINSVAVTIAMYTIIQYYVQLKTSLAAHKPLLKVAAIKLVIFLCFWQTFAISFATTEQYIQANDVLAYPDIAVGIPALLLCFEMALFSIMHQFAYPWQVYRPGAPPIFYPAPHEDYDKIPAENVHGPKSGGPMGIKAIWDAMNLWDVVKAFGRGTRWLFCGVRHRKEDPSYHKERGPSSASSVNTSYPLQPYVKSTDHLPIATEFRRSKFATTMLNSNGPNGNNGSQEPTMERAETPHGDRAALMANAQESPTSQRMPAASNQEQRGRSQEPRQEALIAGPSYQDQERYHQQQDQQDIPATTASTFQNPHRYRSQRQQSNPATDQSYNQYDGQQNNRHQSDQARRYAGQPGENSSPSAVNDRWHGSGPQQQYDGPQAGYTGNSGYQGSNDYHGAPGAAEYNATQSNPAARNPRDSTQLQIGQALWGDRPGMAM